MMQPQPSPFLDIKATDRVEQWKKTVPPTVPSPIVHRGVAQHLSLSRTSSKFLLDDDVSVFGLFIVYWLSPLTVLIWHTHLFYSQLFAFYTHIKKGVISLHQKPLCRTPVIVAL